MKRLPSSSFSLSPPLPPSPFLSTSPFPFSTVYISLFSSPSCILSLASFLLLLCLLISFLQSALPSLPSPLYTNMKKDERMETGNNLFVFVSIVVCQISPGNTFNLLILRHPQSDVKSEANWCNGITEGRPGNSCLYIFSAVALCVRYPEQCMWQFDSSSSNHRQKRQEKEKTLYNLFVYRNQCGLQVTRERQQQLQQQQ